MVSFERPKALIVPSNTEVILNGTIELEPTDIGKYDIISLEGENIYVHGNSTIKGDKFTHKSLKWEWGMGIGVFNSANIKIYDLTIKNCWGDCIVMDFVEGIHINNCTLDNGRRQGISVGASDNVLIDNCLITNVGGTAPQYAIDVEPDPNKKPGRISLEISLCKIA